MNQGFYRKIAYLLGLAALLWPLSWIGAPSTVDSVGGKLAQLRSDAKMGQGDIGAIDPGSEALRMALLGLRGPALAWMWHLANEYKKVEDWSQFRATLDQIARLAPHFVKVWQFQAWNLTYNVSVELDDYRDRFYYVKEGIQYLKRGIGYLRDNPVLLDDLGWFCGNKVGRADEHFWYRKLFRLDPALYPPDATVANRDNWLVSRQWYEQAISAVDDKGQSLGAKNPVTFFDSPARSQMSYAEAIQEEGVYQSLWKSAWEEGGRLWAEYARRPMLSTNGYLIQLGELEKYEALAKEKRSELEALQPGIVDAMRAEIDAKLTPRQRQLLAAMPAEPTPEDTKLQQEALEMTDLTTDEIAARIAKELPDKAAEARRLAKEINDAESISRSISTDRDVANFEYWRLRCAIEQTPEALKARELALEGKRAFQDEGDLSRARRLYEDSFVQWDAALEQFPELTPDSTMGSDIMDFIDAYNKVLEQSDLSLADKEVGDRFPLWRIVEANDGQRKYQQALDAHNARATGLPPRMKPPINPEDGFLY